MAHGLAIPYHTADSTKGSAHSQLHTSYVTYLSILRRISNLYPNRRRMFVCYEDRFLFYRFTQQESDNADCHQDSAIGS